MMAYTGSKEWTPIIVPLLNDTTRKISVMHMDFGGPHLYRYMRDYALDALHEIDPRMHEKYFQDNSFGNGQEIIEKAKKQYGL
jgi:hypothetical protein